MSLNLWHSDEHRYPCAAIEAFAASCRREIGRMDFEGDPEGGDFTGSFEFKGGVNRYAVTGGCHDWAVNIESRRRDSESEASPQGFKLIGGES